jgi:asparagine synthase (glutamine-hydrolysing)
MVNEDGSVALVANGEIYNFLELRQELLAKVHAFRSKSDSEVILHLYEEHGPDCVRLLSGMFAFALFDTRENRLLLARDRAGEKPLFYRRLKHGIAFASEVHALLTGFPHEPPEVDYGAIDEFLTLQYVPSPRSAYLGIAKLPAAHYALLAPGGAARIEPLAQNPRPVCPPGPLRNSRTSCPSCWPPPSAPAGARTFRSAHSCREASTARRSWPSWRRIHHARENVFHRLSPH